MFGNIKSSITKDLLKHDDNKTNTTNDINAKSQASTTTSNKLIFSEVNGVKKPSMNLLNKVSQKTIDTMSEEEISALLENITIKKSAVERLIFQL